MGPCHLGGWHPPLRLDTAQKDQQVLKQQARPALWRSLPIQVPTS